MAKEDTVDTTTENTETKKSIVPTGWKSKGDQLSAFIDEQCKDGEGNFQYAYFFDLCRKNIGGNLTEEKIAHYEGLVADKANNHGIEGRAKMTLRNMLAARVRKEGKIVDRDGDDHEMNLPKPAASGAAAKAQENAAAKAETAGSDDQAEEVDGADEVETDDETAE